MMNEYGKSIISSLAQSIFFMCFLFAVIPYYRANGNTLPIYNITPVQVSELAFWCMFFVFIIGTFWVLGHVISTVCCYAVYFVQRFWYLRKLRKPERIYTGDPV